ncbi:zinc finger protein Xfin-like [Cloeon dipterum]|uniref:zinc finger protein Xfin-like n=1 Tax=Cloeon dipterum TaxID=197152 RepID=UPI003220278A
MATFDSVVVEDRVNCKLCPMEFMSSEFWKNHMIHYHGYGCLHDKVYQCICKYESIDNVEQLQEHLSKRNKCADQVLSSYLSLKSLKNNANVRFRCCEEEFCSTNDFTKHLTEQHMRAFRCKVCQLVSYKKSDIEQHVFNHPVTGNVFSSRFCNFKSSSQTAVEKHETTHSGVYCCHTCKVQFKSQCALGKHQMIHEEGSTIRSSASYYIEKFICNLCMCKFESRNELRNHNPNIYFPDTNANANILVAVKEEPAEFDASMEHQLTPTTDVTHDPNFWTCCHCLYKSYDKLQAEAHSLMHNTACCLQCDFKSQTKKLCAEHSHYPEMHAKRKPHKVVLKKYQVNQARCPCFVFRYACSNCPLVFNEEKTASVINSYFYCTRCPFTSLSRTSLQAHNLSHSDLDVCFGCPICPDETFYNLGDLETHLDQPHSLYSLASCIVKGLEQTSWKCDRCPAVGRTGLVTHMKDHPKLICPLCLSVLDPDEAKEHLTRKTVKKLPSFIITTCCKGSPSLEAYQCTFCPRAFYHSTDVDEHVINDHKNRCKYCASMFGTRLELMEHLRSHNEVQNQFTCEKCFFVIMDREKLLNHQKNCNPKGRKECICKICKKKFAFEEDKRTHEEKEHFQGASHVCPICGMKHRSQLVLLNHVRYLHRLRNPQNSCDCTHCKNTPLDECFAEDLLHFWTCSLCGEIFTHQASLEKHQEQNHNRGPWFCLKCDIIYKDIKFFVAHVKSHEICKV